MTEVEPCKLAVQWRKVSTGDISVYVTLSTPIATLSRRIVATAGMKLKVKRWVMLMRQHEAKASTQQKPKKLATESAQMSD